MRRLILIGALGAVLALGAASCSGDSGEAPAAPDGNAQLELGRDVWIANCARCHGNDGGGKNGPKLSDGDVVDAYPNAADEIRIVTEGKGGLMPAFEGKLSEEEIEAVVAYTRDVL